MSSGQPAGGGDAPPPVRAVGLVKRYGELVAVDNVELNVAAGDVYGYLGPNGAGKTTSLRMLLGLIRPDEGKVELFGRDPLLEGAKALDGVAGFVEAPRFYPYMTGRRNLDLLAAFDGGDAARRIDESLRIVDLDQRDGDKVGGYSHGMRQRLGIAAALLRSPRLLLLDEPATGLDPAGLRDMRSLIRRLAGEGITVMLSSHQLAEVDELCNRVAIIRKGKIAYEGDLAELKRSVATEYRLRTTDDERAVRVSQAQPGVFDVRRTTGGTAGEDAIRLRAEESVIAELSIALGEAGVGLKLLANEQATLEDLFFRLTEGEAVVESDGALA
ncbi:MAG: type transport system ATP-binding protein [Solirubrobacteraceae bacterium]|nr:type transport system ATP-binding protein [Solirubrobacteraceae bacterium]